MKANKLPFLLCQDFIPAFLYPVAKMFPNISGWKKMRTQCEEMSDFIREVARDCKHCQIISNIGWNKFCQVIDQHKENFNPDILEDFIDMFLLEVKDLQMVE